MRKSLKKSHPQPNPSAVTSANQEISSNSFNTPVESPVSKPASRPDSKPDSKVDPLYTIFEKHIYDFNGNDETADQLVDNVANDYVRFLTMKKIVVPFQWRENILVEVRDHAKQILMKKMYGNISVSEYLGKQNDLTEKRKSAHKKYKKLF